MESFVPNALLRDAVERKDAQGVRGILQAMIIPGKSLYDCGVYDAVIYAEKHGVQVYEHHDLSLKLNENETRWNEAYRAKVQAQLSKNFSEERLLHLDVVTAYLAGARGEIMMQAAADSAHEMVEVTLDGLTYPVFADCLDKGNDACVHPAYRCPFRRPRKLRITLKYCSYYTKTKKLAKKAAKKSRHS